MALVWNREGMVLLLTALGAARASATMSGGQRALAQTDFLGLEEAYTVDAQAWEEDSRDTCTSVMTGCSGVRPACIHSRGRPLCCVTADAAWLLCTAACVFLSRNTHQSQPSKLRSQWKHAVHVATGELDGRVQQVAGVVSVIDDLSLIHISEPTRPY